MARQFYKKFFVFKFIPQAEKMNALIASTDSLIERLHDSMVPDSIPDKVFRCLKKGYEKEKQSLPFHDRTITQQEWDQLSKEKRMQVYREINAIRHALLGLDFPNVRAGKWMLGIFAILLAAALMLYIYAHQSGASALVKSGINGGQTLAPPVLQTDVIDAKKLLTLVKTDLETIEAAPESKEQWQAVLTRYQEIVTVLRNESLSLRTQQYAGELGGYIVAQKLENAKASLKALSVALVEDLSEQAGRFFWTKGPKRWLEIASWAFFGVLVGMIFYLSQQLKQGMFDHQDIPSMVGEVVIAPIVTCVIFFLFTYTGITEFAPTDTSIFIILGFAFIFGYAIRRTVGLLDSLKRRILPEP